MNKELQIGACNETDYRLAELAYFERLQAYFNIYPGDMAKAIASEAKKAKKDKVACAEELRLRTLNEFEHTLKTARAIVDPSYKYKGILWDDTLYVEDGFTLVIREHFNLSHKEIVRDMTKKCKAEGIDTGEALRSIQYQVTSVIEWAFESVFKILKRK